MVLERVSRRRRRLPVRALVAFLVDPDRRQATWEPVVAISGNVMAVQPSHSETVPVIRSDRGSGFRMSAPDAHEHASSGSNSSRSGRRHCAYRSISTSG